MFPGTSGRSEQRSGIIGDVARGYFYVGEIVNGQVRKSRDQSARVFDE